MIFCVSKRTRNILFLFLLEFTLVAGLLVRFTSIAGLLVEFTLVAGFTLVTT